MRRARALQIVEGWRKTGQEVWIEDESGNPVDEGTLKGTEIKRPAHYVAFVIGVLLWLVAVAGIFYLMGVWVDGTW